MGTVPDAIEAVRGVSFAVPRGGVVTLIGANGAGKTTTLQTISGLHRPAGGTIWFDGSGSTVCPATSCSAGASPTARRDAG